MEKKEERGRMSKRDKVAIRANFWDGELLKMWLGDWTNSIKDMNLADLSSIPSIMYNFPSPSKHGVWAHSQE